MWHVRQNRTKNCQPPLLSKKRQRASVVVSTVICFLVLDTSWSLLCAFYYQRKAKEPVPEPAKTFSCIHIQHGRKIGCTCWCGSTCWSSRTGFIKRKNPGRVEAGKPASNPCHKKRDREPKWWSHWLFASWHWRPGGVCSGCSLSGRADYGYPMVNPSARAKARLQSSVNGVKFFHIIIYGGNICCGSRYQDCKAVWHLGKL